MAEMNSEMQQKYVELQLMDKQMKQVQQQLQMVDAQFMELTVLQQGLEEFKDVKKGADMLAPVGNGIFVKTSLVDKENLLVSVGSNVIVKKSVEEAKQMLNTQLDELSAAKNQLVAGLSQMTAQMQEIEKSAQALLPKK